MLRLEGVRAGAEVRGVDLELRRGEIVGLAGLQGQGQEELLEAIAGFRRLERRHASVHRGERVAPRMPRDMIRRGVCLVPNDRHRQGLFIDETVGENLGYVRVCLDAPALAPAARRAARFRRRRPSAACSSRRTGRRSRSPTLSGGNQQKVVIGKWLAVRYQVLLLSDPTKGVDIHARSEIYATLGDLAAEGSAVLVFASDVQELLAALRPHPGDVRGPHRRELAGDAMSEQRVMAAAFGKAA